MNSYRLSRTKLFKSRKDKLQIRPTNVTVNYLRAWVIRRYVRRGKNLLKRVRRRLRRLHRFVFRIRRRSRRRRLYQLSVGERRSRFYNLNLNSEPAQARLGRPSRLRHTERSITYTYTNTSGNINPCSIMSRVGLRELVQDRVVSGGTYSLLSFISNPILMRVSL